MPVMLVELASMFGALWYAGDETDAMMRVWLWLAAALLGIIWLSTFLLQVPAHQKLTSGFDERIHRRLVATNWLRTFAWTARSTLLCVVLVGSH